MYDCLANPSLLDYYWKIIFCFNQMFLTDTCSVSENRQVFFRYPMSKNRSSSAWDFKTQRYFLLKSN